MSIMEAITGAEIFDGEIFHQDSALIIADGRVVSIVAENDVAVECNITRVNGGVVCAGFVDLQANGGGGVLLNDKPDIDGIRTICSAHAKFGTAALLPTLITDTVEITTKAIAAGIEAHLKKVPGFLGLHLEGPHLSVAKKGVHDPSLIRPMKEEDVEQLLMAKMALPYLMVTVAPESVTTDQIFRLSRAGIIVSLGHSNASYEAACAAANAGARCVTHLFNAMSPLGHREPGVVGAALDTGSLFCGLIADGFHVKPAAISIALAAKKQPGKIFLITDAMSSLGTKMTSFSLNGRTIRRAGGRLTLENGTLAGADLDMNSAVRYMRAKVGIELDEAIRMATLYPAQCMKADHELGHLKPGARANIIHLDTQLEARKVRQS